MDLGLEITKRRKPKFMKTVGVACERDEPQLPSEISQMVSWDSGLLA